MTGSGVRQGGVPVKPFVGPRSSCDSDKHTATVRLRPSRGEPTTAVSERPDTYVLPHEPVPRSRRTACGIPLGNASTIRGASRTAWPRA